MSIDAGLVVLGSKRGHTTPAHVKPFIERVGRSDGNGWVSYMHGHCALSESDMESVGALRVEGVYAPQYMIKDIYHYIDINADNPPTEYDKNLLRDIRVRGLLHPIIVAKTGALIAGVARLWSYMELGHKTIPAWVINETKAEFFRRYLNDFVFRIDDPEAVYP